MNHRESGFTNYFTKLLIFTFLLFSINKATASTISELRQNYNQSSDDTNRLASALELALEFNDKDSSFIWHKKAIDIAQQIGAKQLGNAYYARAFYFLSLAERDSAALSFEKAFATYEKDSLLPEIFATLNQLTSVYLDLGKYLKVHDYSTKKLELSQSFGDKFKVAESYHDLGYLYFYMGEYYLSLENYLKAIDLFHEEGFEYNCNISKYYCAMLYFRIADYENCEELIQNALIFFKQYESEYPESKPSYTASIYKRLALLDIETENYSRGLAYCDSAFVILKHSPSIGWVYAHLGVIYTKLDNYEKAKANFELSKKYVPQCDHCYWPIYTDMSEYFLHFGMSDSAIHYANITLSRAITYRYDIRILRTYKVLAEAYSNKGNHTKAYKYSQKYIDLYKTALDKRKLSMLKKAESDFWKKKSDAQIQGLREENLKHKYNLAKQRLFIFFSVAIALLLFVLFFIVYRFQKQKQKILQKEKEMAIITSRISGQEEERTRLARELHDGVAANLSGIRMNLMNQKSSTEGAIEVNKLVRQITDVGKEIRTISHNLSSPIFADSNLEEVIQNYILQFTGKKYLDIQLSVFPKIDWIKIESVIQKEIYRIFQELVNNTIKHANASELSVQIVKHEQQINVIFEDNGKGIDENANSGIGLRNIQERVHSLNGAIDIVSSREQGFSVAIEIPLSIASQKTSLS